jgi:hypothetical protein
MNSQLDPSKLPVSTYADEIWFAQIVLIEIAKITRLYEAILKWDQVSGEEFDKFRLEAESRWTHQWDDYGYDPVADELFMLLCTQRVMFANLAVSIAACAENFILQVCTAREVNCLNNKKQTDYGIACNSLGNALGVVIAQLPGYDGNQRARILGNCFKHSEGKKNDRFVEKFGGAVDEAIEYEKEDWPLMIADTQELLSGITSHLCR